MYKVLIVEDEALFRKALTKIIESMENFQVIGQLGEEKKYWSFVERKVRILFVWTSFFREKTVYPLVRE